MSLKKSATKCPLIILLLKTPLTGITRDTDFINEIFLFGAFVFLCVGFCLFVWVCLLACFLPISSFPCPQPKHQLIRGLYLMQGWVFLQESRNWFFHSSIFVSLFLERSTQSFLTPLDNDHPTCPRYSRLHHFSREKVPLGFLTVWWLREAQLSRWWSHGPTQQNSSSTPRGRSALLG